MSKNCKCGQRMRSLDERRKGECISCTVSSWSPEKRKAMDRLLASAFDGSTDEAKDNAVAEAFKHMPAGEG